MALISDDLPLPRRPTSTRRAGRCSNSSRRSSSSRSFTPRATTSGNFSSSCSKRSTPSAISSLRLVIPKVYSRRGKNAPRRGRRARRSVFHGFGFAVAVGQQQAEPAFVEHDVGLVALDQRGLPHAGTAELFALESQPRFCRGQLVELGDARSHVARAALIDQHGSLVGVAEGERILEISLRPADLCCL